MHFSNIDHAPSSANSDVWGDFPPEPRDWRKTGWVALGFTIVVGIMAPGSYIWNRGDSSESTLDRISGLSTVSLALAGFGTASLAVISMIESRRLRVAQSRPIVFPVLTQTQSHDGAPRQVHLVLVNDGYSGARDLTFRVSPRIKASVGGPFVEDHFRWRKPIGFLPRNGEIPIDIWGRDPQHILNRSGDQILTVYLRYRHGFTNDIYRERFELNLDQYGYGYTPSSDGRMIIWGNRLRTSN